MFDPPTGCKDAYEHSRLLPIPGIVDDYNYYIGGVDIADQLRAKFANWPRGVKPWKPLFYWLLGTSMTNAYLLWEHHCKAKLGLAKDNKVRSQHRDFYEAVVQALLVEPVAPRQASRPDYRSLPPIQLNRPIEIHVRVQRTRTKCFFCRYLECQKKEAQKSQTTFRMPKTQGS